MDVIMYIVVLLDKIHINNFDKELFVYDDFYNLVHDDKNHDHTKDNLEEKNIFGKNNLIKTYHEFLIPDQDEEKHTLYSYIVQI
jgi:hypothetical protein